MKWSSWKETVTRPRHGIWINWIHGINRKVPVIAMTQNKAVVDIRLRQRCAISPPRSWPICRIACAQKFSEYYFRLPGIVSDPVCCMAFWRLNDPFCSDRDAAVKIAKLLNGPDNPENCPFPLEDLHPCLIHGSFGPPESYSKTVSRSV